MKENFLLENIDKPDKLEEAYRRSPQDFEEQLNEALELNGDSETLKVWNARLRYHHATSQPKSSIGFLVFLCLVAWVIVKIPSFLPVDDNWFYPRFAPVTVISAMIVYFVKTSESRSGFFRYVLGTTFLSFLYLAILPNGNNSASIIMAIVHLPLFALSLLAVSFMGNSWKSVKCRLEFIRYLGELAIYSALILLGGMILTAITLSLFSLIDLSIHQWYLEYVVVLGLVSAPLVATYIFDSVQNRQSKFASILSNVFSPLFLITVLAYLFATSYQGKSPFTDRDFLITFNGLLIAILALTIFSVSGKKTSSSPSISDYINVALIGATLLVDTIALSAILFRWAEYGLTVNRVVVSGANIVIFVHLVLLLKQYVGYLKHGQEQYKLQNAIANYLPVYTVWSLIVAVFLPLAFGYQ